MPEDAGDPNRRDAEYWESQATLARRSALHRLQEIAGKWETAIGTLLGIFVAVAFVQGPNKLDELNSGGAQLTLIVLVLVAAALAAAATYFAALAA